MIKSGYNYIQRRQRLTLVLLLSLAVFISAFGDVAKANNTVRGKIVNEAGEPIVGAVVSLKDSKATGTTTDADGNFMLSLNRRSKDAVLYVRYIGYSAKNVAIGDDKDNVGVIEMKQDAYSLNDVVVIGYGETSRQKLTGSVAKVKGDVIATQTEDSPLLALQGNAAGVYIQQCTGVPGGANSTIAIRGYNSFSTSRLNTMPLYIVDGVTLTHDSKTPVSYMKEGVFEYPDVLSLINPSDIESIEILKDADATAIYGTRGANGVVIITTKKGKAGKVKVNFSADATASWMAKRLDFCSTEEYLQLRKDAFASDLKNGYVSESDWNESNFPDFFLWDQNADYDWQSALMGGTSWAKNVQLNVSGGSRNTTFMVSGGYYKANTVTCDDDSYTRWTGSANIQHHTDDNRLHLEAGVNITNLMEQSYAAISGYALLNTAPNCPTYDENGNPYYIPDDPDFSSPMASRGFDGLNDVTTLMANASASYRIWDRLTAKVKVAYAFSASNENNAYDSYYNNPYKDTTYNIGEYYTHNTKTVNIEPQLTWSHDFFGGKATFLLGGTYEYNNVKSSILCEKDYLDFFIKNAAAGNIVTSRSNPEVQVKTASYFGRITYDYKNRYIGNVVLRRDGSSRFGDGNKWGTFYSMGGAWLFTNEKFIKESGISKWLSFGKLRMSYGKTGNDNVGNYEYMTTYSVSKYPYNSESGLIPDNYGDENLHWKTVRKFDIALELGFLKDRILFSANYYCNTSSDLLKSKKVSSQVGYSSVTTNIDAEIRNTGWELELNAKLLENKDWRWNANVNMTFPKNKLLRYANLESSAYADTYVIGKSINLCKRYKYLGVNPENGRPLFQSADGTATETPTTDDKVIIGDFDPDMYGGFNNTVKYKNLTLDLSFYFRVKPIQNGFYYSFNTPAGMMKNVLREYAQDYWSETNTDAKFPGITSTSSSPLYTSMDSYLDISDFGISTGTYLKLSNVKLSYSLPRKFVSKLKLDNASVYVQGKNLFTITGYDAYSPETADGWIAPLTSFSFGFNIGL